MGTGAPPSQIAAYRLTFERLQAPFGDAVADDRLARDVAGSHQFTGSEDIARYLGARTAFFDRVLVGALERDVTQVACLGAGYDGRSLRYAKPEVRFFEVDHPATQVDKRRRLERLSLEASHIEFIALDLQEGGVLAALLGGGWEPEARSLMLCEGAAISLDAAALSALLGICGRYPAWGRASPSRCQLPPARRTGARAGGPPSRPSASRCATR
jgi:methyltransferase (TIGR00027 family)